MRRRTTTTCKVWGVECGELVKTKMWGSSLRGIRAGCRQNCEVRGVLLIMYRWCCSQSGTVAGEGMVTSIVSLCYMGVTAK